MRGLNWRIVLAISLVVLSVISYLFHYMLFSDLHHIFIFMVGDIAFVPIEVLLVTLIIHQVLSQREKQAMLSKLNMVIGAFFSEVGTALLTSFSSFDLHPHAIGQELSQVKTWSKGEFPAVRTRLRNHAYEVDSRRGHLEGLRSFVLEKRDFILRLLENPNLLEHEKFTELLWAVSHLTEELAHRTDVSDLPDSDYAHLSGDIRRAYILLVDEWIDYMEHLREHYPYLFSLAIRTNPFDATASPVVT